MRIKLIMSMFADFDWTKTKILNLKFQKSVPFDFAQIFIFSSFAY